MSPKIKVEKKQQQRAILAFRKWWENGAQKAKDRQHTKAKRQAA